MIQRLAEGFDLSSADEVKFEQELVEKGLAPPDHAGDLASHLLHISTVCNEFLKGTKYDKIECETVDKLWKLIDANLIEFNIENIENIAASIGEVVGKRIARFDKLEEDKLAKKYAEEG